MSALARKLLAVAAVVVLPGALCALTVALVAQLIRRLLLRRRMLRAAAAQGQAGALELRPFRRSVA